MATSDNTVVFQISLSGLQPGEAQRVVDTAMGQVRAAMGQQNEKMVSEGKEASEKLASAWKESIRTIHDGVELAGVAFDKLKEVAEQLEHVVNIYGSAHIDITKASQALKGTVTDIDLMAAANRASLKEMDLTQDQFATLARAAGQFAHATGGDVKEALESLIDGLAQGQTKMLKHVGVMIDAKQAEDKYADSLGKTREELTEHEKAVAIQTTAFEKLNSKLEDGADKGSTLAEVMRGLVVEIKNIGNEALNAVGKINLGSVHTSEYNAKYSSLQDRLGHGEINQAEFDKLAQQLALASLNALGKSRAEAAAALSARNQGDLDALHESMGDEGEPTVYGSEENKNIAYNEALRRWKNRGKVDPGELAHQRFMASMDMIAMQGESDSLGGPATSTGVAPTEPSREGWERFRKTIEESNKKLLEQHGLQEGGLMSKLLFGEKNSPEDLQDKLKSFSDFTLDSMGMVSDAGKQMAEAVGQSLAAAIAGDGTANLAKRSKAIVEQLAAVAYTQAIFETAMGLASLATGNPIAGLDAPKHFASAAAFAAVGTAAGLSARAIGATASGSSSASTPTSSRSSSFSSGSSSRGDNQSPAPAINLFVFPGGEAEAGRKVNDALDAYNRKYGKRAN